MSAPITTAGGFAAGGISGGNLQSAIQGAFFAGLTSGLASAFGLHGAAGFGTGKMVGQMALHAAVGCGQAAAAGGSCKAGAISGATSAFGSGAMTSMGISNFGAKLIANSMIGAVASKLSGGKAENGALSAAFGFFFNEFATFDGRTFRFFDDDGKLLGAWKAMSGNPNFQDFGVQSVSGKSPMAEGVYEAKQMQYQSIDSISAVDRFLGYVGRGPWPGLETSWGSERVWLNQIAGETFGRSGYTIHGGAEYGSAGCIDLANAANQFFRMFRSSGQDIRIYVKYGNDKWITGSN